MEVPHIGRSVARRKEGRAKVTGQAPLRRRHLAGRDVCTASRSAARSRAGASSASNSIPAIPWDEFTVVTAADIPGGNRVELIVDDQPYLADDVVNHPEEPIVLLAHRRPRRCSKKRAGTCTIDIEPLPAGVLDRRGAGGREIIWGDDNIFKTLHGAQAATWTRRFGRRRRSSSKASTRPARRSSSTSSRTA